MKYHLILSPEAENDIDEAFDYYESISPGLGERFTTELDTYLLKIFSFPTASAIRYKDIRIRAVKNFPYVIHYSIDAETIIIGRIFNTHQKPIW